MTNDGNDYGKCALGLMSGTSGDGIDAALLWTDGERIDRIGANITITYDVLFKDYIKKGIARAKNHAEKTRHDATIQGLEEELTRRHAQAVSALLKEAVLRPGDVDVIGFHGHTLDHRPDAGPGERLTWQIGDGALLAKLIGIDVVSDFRSADMARGGQGAPLLPLYHAAIMRGLTTEDPVAVLNIGGVANVTWIRFSSAPGDRGAGDKLRDEPEILAFDTGPGNALIDDWMQQRRGQPFDEGGALAATGSIDDSLLAGFLADPFFAEPPPKSLDRAHFSFAALEGLSAADGAATLTAFTAAVIQKAQDWMPVLPQVWYLAGGGRYNRTLVKGLEDRLEGRVAFIDEAGLEGDAIEAQGFAYLAVRSLRGLPLSLPGTTGVDAPCKGGVLHRA